MSRIYLKCSTIQELAEVCHKKYISYGKRDNGENYTFTNDKAPQWFKDLVYKAHKIDNVLPNDYIYNFIDSALSLIADVPEAHDIQEEIFEIEGDIYNSDLLKWVSNNLTFASHVDEVITEYGTDQNTTLFSLLMLGQREHRQTIALCILNGLETRLEEIKEE